MGWTIAGAIEEAHHLAGVGETDEQDMVAPGAIVSDVDAFLALGGGGHQGAVGVEHGLIEERFGLLFPNTDANLVEDVLQKVDMVGLEAPAEITGRGRIWDAPGAEGVQEMDVVTAQLDVLQTIAIAQGVVSQIEHMIGFVIRQMNLEKLESFVDGVNEADASGQQVKGAHAAVGDAMHALSDFVMDVAGAEHGMGTIAKFGFVEPVLDLALAGGQPSA